MTKVLDKGAYRRFTPRELHPHMLSFDDFLRNEAKRSPRLASILSSPCAFFPCNDHLPVIHVVALKKDGDWHYFPAPLEQYSRKDGHRFVVENLKKNRGSMQPLLRLEVVTDPKLTAVFDDAVAERAIKFGAGKITSEDQEKYTKIACQAKVPAVIFTAPLGLIRKGYAHGLSAKRFTLYQHIFGAGHEYPDDGAFYIGITTRDWKTRWSEHRRSIRNGSKLKFHRTYRERLEANQLTYVHHKIMGVSSNLTDLQNLEETFVKGHWEDERLMNMIPGGRAGIAFLHKHGVISNKEARTSDQIDKKLQTWLRDTPRQRLKAPWVADKWKDDQYALKVVCGPEGRLSVEQVHTIRALAAKGVNVDDIMAACSVRNPEQVENVIAGKTYKRVPLLE